VLLDFTQFDSFDWVGLQHAPDQVFAVWWDFHRHPVVALLDLHKQQGQLLVIERQASADHGIQDDTA